MLTTKLNSKRCIYYLAKGKIGRKYYQQNVCLNTTFNSKTMKQETIKTISYSLHIRKESNQVIEVDTHIDRNTIL